MAMTAREKRVFRTAMGTDKYADILIAIIDGGSATALADITEKKIKDAIANDKLGDNVIAAFETGSALSDPAKKALRKMIGERQIADDIITQINAIT